MIKKTKYRFNIDIVYYLIDKSLRQCSLFITQYNQRMYKGTNLDMTNLTF